MKFCASQDHPAADFFKAELVGSSTASDPQKSFYALAAVHVTRGLDPSVSGPAVDNFLSHVHSYDIARLLLAVRMLHDVKQYTPARWQVRRAAARTLRTCLHGCTSLRTSISHHV